MANPTGMTPGQVLRAQQKMSGGGTLDASDAHVMHMWNTGQWDVYQRETEASRAAGTPAGTQTQANVDTQNSQRDASVILSNLFTQYGLGTLASTITGYIQQGYSADAISVLLQQTPEYKQRFAANDARIKKGLPALSPADYINTENSYRQVMAQAGLPLGFYDQTGDFTSFIANDMSPTELKQRVDTATTAVRQAPSDTLDYFKQWYSSGDLIAYALDPNRAEPLVEQRIKAAEAAGVGKTQGVGLDQSTAEQIGNQNVTLDQIRQGMGFVGSELPNASKLGQIYGDNVTQNDLVNEAFLQDGLASQKRAKLGQKEQATFGGSSGTSNVSLASESKL